MQCSSHVNYPEDICRTASIGGRISIESGLLFFVLFRGLCYFHFQKNVYLPFCGKISVAYCLVQGKLGFYFFKDFFHRM